MSSFLRQFKGKYTTDFTSISDDDTIFFKCKNMKKSFSIKSLDNFLNSTNRPVAFSSLEKVRGTSFVIVGLESAAYIKETALDLLIFFTTNCTYAKIYRCTKPGAEIIRMLMLNSPKEQNNDVGPFGLRQSAITTQNQIKERDEFDRNFPNEKHLKNFSWDSPAFVVRITPNEIEKKLMMYSDSKLVEDISPYREYVLANHNSLLNFPQVSSFALEQLSLNRSVFESTDL